MEHTPEPWYFNKGASNNKPMPDDCLGAIKGDDWILAEVKSDGPNPEADAAFIIRAVNNHDALLSALEGLMLFFQSGNEIPITRVVINANSEWVTKARAAILAAKGEMDEETAKIYKEGLIAMHDERHPDGD